jgi:hypothetical protein
MHDTPVQEQVEALTRQCLDLWWSCERALPGFPYTYTPQQQAENEKKLERWVAGLIAEMRQMPAGVEERQALETRLRPYLTDFARTSLNLEERHMEFIETTGIAGAMQAFARMARAFDPTIRAEDIYQAGRNVMTMNFFQLLLDLPVEVTPAVFAYSMLYPYTDNYLDDPAITRTTKLAFNHRFEQRLKGAPVRPANASEETIGRLVGMIETQWDRARYPQVYESLLAIHAAQARSMALVLPGAAPYELDVLGISFEKGGASVLADGYLVAGTLTEAQAAFLFGYGAYTQLMDDLEDLEGDMREGSLTVFSQAAGRWPLDALTNRLIHFSRALFRDLSAFPGAAAGPMTELIERGIDPVLLDIAGRSAKHYSKNYLREVERYIPYRFASTRRQREKLARQKIAVEKMVELML